MVNCNHGKEQMFRKVKSKNCVFGSAEKGWFKMKKSFIQFSRQNYYETLKSGCAFVDEVHFGNFYSDGSCEYELAMQWVELTACGYEVVPKLEIFSDAFKFFDNDLLLFEALAELHGKHFSPADFCRLLVKLGYEDLSDNELK